MCSVAMVLFTVAAVELGVCDGSCSVEKPKDDKEDEPTGAP